MNGRFIRINHNPLAVLNALPRTGRYMVRRGQTEVVMNDQTREYLSRVLRDLTNSNTDLDDTSRLAEFVRGYYEDERDSGKSSDRKMGRIISTNSGTIEIIKLPDGGGSNGGAFYPYNAPIDFHQALNELLYGLDRIGLFAKSDVIDDEERYKNNCLYNALFNAGLPKEECDKMKVIVKSRFFPTHKLNNLCQALNIRIKLHRRKKDTKDNRTGVEYGTTGDLYHIALIDKHYFVYDNAYITSFALMNWKEVYTHYTVRWGAKNTKKVLNWKNVVGRKSDGGYATKKNRWINTLTLFGTIHDNREHFKLTPIDNKILLNSKFHEQAVIDKPIEPTVAERTMAQQRAYIRSMEKKNVETRELSAYDCFPLMAKEDGKYKHQDCNLNAIDMDRVYYFDYETAKMKSGRIKPFCLYYMNALDKKATQINTSDLLNTIIKRSTTAPSILRMKRHMKKTESERSQNKVITSLLYAHNCRFDISFLLNSESLKQWRCSSYMGKGSSFTMCKFERFIKGWKHEVIIKCSYRLLAMPLGKFAKCRLVKKQAKDSGVPYGIFTDELLNAGYIPLKLAQEDLEDYLYPEKGKQAYKELMDQIYRGAYDRVIRELNKQDPGLPLVKGTKFHLGNYAREYCGRDVECLAEGMATFQSWCKPKDKFGIDITGRVSSSNLADAYMKKEGVYDGIYQIGGVPRAYLQQFVSGGRTMTRNNDMFHIITIPKGDTLPKNQKEKLPNGKTRHTIYTHSVIEDFDAVSEYPASMKRLAERHGGFLKGAPKLIPQTVLDMSPAKQLEWLSTVDGYFVDFKVSKVGKKRPFPITSIKNKTTGVRDYTNDLVGKTIKLHRFTLEDLINFQEAEGKVIQGYYFNEGRNPKIGEVINYLFESRLHHKGKCINDKGKVVKRYELNEQGVRVEAPKNPIQ